MKIAIAFFSFNRTRLMKLTLKKVVDFMPKDCVLKVFQDGATIQDSGEILAPDRVIERNISFFRDTRLDYFHSPVNICIGEMVLRAMQWGFEEVRADVLYLIEDDHFISRFYFRAMKQLSRMALGSDVIGPFSAYGDSSLSVWQKFKKQREFVLMHHLWAYGIARHFWLKILEKYQAYLKIIAGSHFRHRPNPAITQYLKTLTPNRNLPGITSQDGALLAMTHNVDCIAVTCIPSHVINIGKKGLHFRPSFYYQNLHLMNGASGLFSMPTFLPKSLSKAQIDDLKEKQKFFPYN